jgi:hypothetical protein
MTQFEITQVFSTYSLAWAILPLDEFRLVTQEFENTTVNYIINQFFNVKIIILR